MSTFRFGRSEAQSFAEQVRNARERRDAAARRSVKRLGSDPARGNYRRNFTKGVVCRTPGCDRDAYAIDPLRKRDKVFLCKMHYMRSHRVIVSDDPDARKNFRAKYGY